MEFGEFHDGWFEGLWIDGKTAHVFLATDAGERSVIVLEGVEALTVDGVKAGNIIYEVLTRDHTDVNLQDIQTLYAIQTGATGELQAASLLEKVRVQGGKILEINPSYGATCLVLAASVDLLRREDWVKRNHATA